VPKEKGPFAARASNKRKHKCGPIRSLFPNTWQLQGKIPAFCHHGRQGYMQQGCGIGVANRNAGRPSCTSVSTTATDASLLYRVSQLVLEGIGFIGVDLSPTKPRGRRWETYYHPGGAKIWRYCRNPNFPLRKPHDPFIQRDPTDVFIAWCVESDKCCPVCDERRLFDDLKGEPQFLNTSRPQACKKHHP